MARLVLGALALRDAWPSRPWRRVAVPSATKTSEAWTSLWWRGGRHLWRPILPIPLKQLGAHGISFLGSWYLEAWGLEDKDA